MFWIICCHLHFLSKMNFLLLVLFIFFLLSIIKHKILTKVGIMYPYIHTICMYWFLCWFCTISTSPQLFCYFYFLDRILTKKLERTSYFCYTCSAFLVVGFWGRKVQYARTGVRTLLHDIKWCLFYPWSKPQIPAIPSKIHFFIPFHHI